MSIEKYLKEINNEVAMENTGALLGGLLLAIGATGYGVYRMVKSDIEKHITGSKLKEKQEREEKLRIINQSIAEKKEKQKELLKKYGGTVQSLIKLVVNDIKKMVAKMNQDSEKVGTIMYEKVQDEITHYNKKLQEEYKNYKFKLITDMSGLQDDGGYIQIVPKTSPFDYSWVIHDIVKALDIKYKDAVDLHIIIFDDDDAAEGYIEIHT